MNEHGILNTKYLKYRFNSDEVSKLKKIKEQTVEIYDFGIDMSRLLFTMLDSITKKENPMKYILCNNSECKKNQLIFSIMLLFFGLLLFFLANILA